MSPQTCRCGSWGSGQSCRPVAFSYSHPHRVCVLGGRLLSPAGPCWLPPAPPAALTVPCSRHRSAPSVSRVLALLSQDALDGLMLEGENIVSAARKAIIRHDFSAVLTVFPILRHLKQTKPEFDQVLQVCGWEDPWGPGEGEPPSPPSHLCSIAAWKQLLQGPGQGDPAAG